VSKKVESVMLHVATLPVVVEVKGREEIATMAESW